MNKQLEFINVSLTYQTKSDQIKAIESLSFNCHEGEFLSIIGPSGCGKTTILSLIAGLIKPTKGVIKINGSNVSADKNQIALGYILQKDPLFPADH